VWLDQRVLLSSALDLQVDGGLGQGLQILPVPPAAATPFILLLPEAYGGSIRGPPIFMRDNYIMLTRSCFPWGVFIDLLGCLSESPSDPVLHGIPQSTFFAPALEIVISFYNDFAGVPFGPHAACGVSDKGSVAISSQGISRENTSLGTAIRVIAIVMHSADTAALCGNRPREGTRSQTQNFFD